jgi:hypothetical protein
LGRLGIIQTDMNKLSERRLKENEVIFQQANKGVAEFVQEATGDDNPTIRFYCECSNIDCRQRIPLPAKKYTDLHQNNRQFIALTGHEMPEIEEIVVNGPGYSVVEKFGEIPSPEDIEATLPNLA